MIGTQRLTSKAQNLLVNLKLKIDAESFVIKNE